MANLRDLMKELGFEELVEGTPTLWKRDSGEEEVLVGQMSDGEIHVTKASAGRVPLVVRLSRFDDGLEGLLRGWLLVDA